MQKLNFKPYLFAIVLLLLVGALSSKFYGLKEPSLIIMGATAMLVLLNISSILFYLSLTGDSKITKVLFSIVNVLIFLFIGVFIMEIFTHTIATT